MVKFMKLQVSKDFVKKLVDTLFSEGNDLNNLEESLKLLSNELGADAVWLSNIKNNAYGLLISNGLLKEFEVMEKIYHKNCQCRMLSKESKAYGIFYLEECIYIPDEYKKHVGLHYHYAIPLKTKKEYIGVLNIAFSKEKTIPATLIEFIAKIYSSAYANYLYCGKLEEQSKELTKKNSDLETIVSAISHDLKTPIISAKGFLQIMKDKYSKKLDKQVLWYLKCIESSIKRAEELVKDLLNLSNVEKMLNAVEEVYLKDVIKSSIRNISHLVRNRKPKIIINGGNLKIKSNWHALFHIFTNLIANAIKYTPDDRKPHVLVNIEKEGNQLLLKVKDNGIGLTSKEVQSIFKPFNKIKTLEREGSGVGLSIVKKLVEGMEGTIDVVSEKNKGTEFIIKIPYIISAEGEIRTRTGLTPLDPEPSVSANSTTSATMNTLYEEKLKRSSA
jgi:two-component sensor histidine kinase